MFLDGDGFVFWDGFGGSAALSAEEKVSVEFTESEARELISAFKRARVFQWKLQDALKALDDKRQAGWHSKLVVDGRQYRVSDPASRYPEVLVFVSHKNNEWHWRRLPGNDERYWQIIELARARKKED